MLGFFFNPRSSALLLLDSLCLHGTEVPCYVCTHSFERLFSSFPSLVPHLLRALLFHFYFCNPSHLAGLLSSALSARSGSIAVQVFLSSLLPLPCEAKAQVHVKCPTVQRQDNQLTVTSATTSGTPASKYCLEKLFHFCQMCPQIMCALYFFFSGQTYCVFTCCWLT